MKHIAEFLSLLVACSGCATHDLPGEVDVHPVKVVEIPHFCEGAVLDRQGNLYVSDTEGGIIYRIVPGGEPAIWARTPSPNGHKILPDGTHLVCEQASPAILHLDAQGRIMDSVTVGIAGKHLRGPNDICIDPAGGYYFTDPMSSGADNPIGAVYHVGPDGAVSQVADDLAYPNGVVLRPGGKILIVGEGEKNRILEFQLSAPGKVESRRVFAELPVATGEQIGNHPDGMALDTDGNLFVAHFGMRQVQVLSPAGELLRRYPAGNLAASNLAFAGGGRLYISGAIGRYDLVGAVFRIDLGSVEGQALPWK